VTNMIRIPLVTRYIVVDIACRIATTSHLRRLPVSPDTGLRGQNTDPTGSPAFHGMYGARRAHGKAAYAHLHMRG
jgi:hypothetical protein